MNVRFEGNNGHDANGPLCANDPKRTSMCTLYEARTSEDERSRCTTLTEMSSGTVSNAPIGPHIQAQKASLALVLLFSKLTRNA